MNHFLADIDESWTLFLDRDGVINEKLDNDYVKNIAELLLILEKHPDDLKNKINTDEV